MSLSKVLKHLITRNDLAPDASKLYFQRAEQVLAQFHAAFIRDELVTTPLQTVRTDLQGELTRFLAALLSFTTRAAFLKSAQARPMEAAALYQTGYSLCRQVVSSSTSVVPPRVRTTSC